MGLYRIDNPCCRGQVTSVTAGAISETYIHFGRHLQQPTDNIKNETDNLMYIKNTRKSAKPKRSTSSGRAHF